MSRNGMLLASLAVCAAGLIGFGLGRLGGGSADPVSAQPFTVSAGVHGNEAATDRHPAVSDPLRGSALAERRRLLERVARMSLTELRKTARLALEDAAMAGERGPGENNAAELALLRLADEAPEETYAWLVGKDLELRQFFRYWGSLDLDAALDTISGLQRNQQQVPLNAAVLGLAESNAGLAWRQWQTFSETRSGVSLSPTVVSSLFGQWARQDAASAKLALEGISDPNVAGYAFDGFLKVLAEIEPFSAAELYLERHNTSFFQSNEDAGSLSGSSVFEALTRADPDAALRSFEQLRGEARDAAARAIVDVLASSDRDAAFAFVDRLPTRLRQQGQKSILRQWLDDDAAGALAYLEAEGTPALRADLGSQIAETIAERDGALAALDWISGNLAGDLQFRAADAAMSFFDPSDAAQRDAVFNLPASPMRTAALKSLIRQWPGASIAEALAWADGLPPGPDRYDLRQMAVQRFAKIDPRRALASVDWATELQPGGILEGNVNLFRDLARSLPAREADAALDWIETLPDGDERAVAISAFFSQLADTQPDRLAELVAVTEDLRLREQAQQAWLDTMVDEAPERVASQLAQVPELDPNYSLTRRLAARWFATDPAAAHSWLERVPEGPQFDAAIDSLVHVMRDTDPAYAFEWAQLMSPGRYRTSNLEQLVRRWAALEPEAAAKAVEEGDFNPEVRHALQGALQQPELRLP